MEITISDIFINHSDLAILRSQTPDDYYCLVLSDLIHFLRLEGPSGKKIIDIIDKEYFEFEKLCSSDNVALQGSLFRSDGSLPLLRIDLNNEIEEPLMFNEDFPLIPEGELEKKEVMITEAKTIIDSEQKRKLIELRDQILDECLQEMEDKNFERATEILEEGVIRFPEYQPFRVNIGVCYTQTFRYAEALESFEKAFECGDICVELLMSRSEAFRKIGNYNNAVCDIRKALILGKRKDDIIEDLALTYCEMSDYPNAVRIAKKIIKTRPNEEIGYSILGNIYEEMNEYHKAIELYNHILYYINPIDSWAFYFRGRAKFELLLNPESAIEDLEFSATLGNSEARLLLDEINEDMV